MFPQVVAVASTGKFAYVANFSSHTVSAYTINASSGALTPVKGSPFAAGSGPYGVAVGVSSKHAYVTNYGSANVSAYAINANSGALRR